MVRIAKIAGLVAVLLISNTAFGDDCQQDYNIRVAGHGDMFVSATADGFVASVVDLGGANPGFDSGWEMAYSAGWEVNGFSAASSGSGYVQSSGNSLTVTFTINPPPQETLPGSWVVLVDWCDVEYAISFEPCPTGCVAEGYIDVDGDGVCDCDDPDGDGTCDCGPGWVDDGAGDCQECAAIGPTHVECADGTCGEDADGDGVCDEDPDPDPCSCDTPEGCSPTQLEALDCEPTECDCDAEDGDYLYTREDGVEVYNECTTEQREECGTGKCDSCCRSGEVVYECDCTKPNGVILGENEKGDLVRNSCSEYQREECEGTGPDVGIGAGARYEHDVYNPLLETRDVGFVGVEQLLSASYAAPAPLLLHFPAIGYVAIPMATSSNSAADYFRLSVRKLLVVLFFMQVCGAVHRVVRQY